MVAFDVLDLYCRLIEEECTSDDLPPRESTSQNHSSVKTRDVIYACRSIYGRKVTKSNPLKVSTLINGIKGMNGQVKITEIFKNKMGLVWFGEGEPPPIMDLKQFAMFAVGPDIDFERQVKIYSRGKGPKCKEYEVVLDKSLQYDRPAIFFAAGNLPDENYREYFDYIDPILKELYAAK